MCGLTGFITSNANQIGQKDRGTYLRQTLMVDSLRGFHSTGVFYGTKDAEEGTKAGWAKQCTHGIDFVQSKNYAEIDKKMHTLRFAVGHNRWATTGDSDDIDNAHPFQEGSITLAHNGTLDGDGGLLTSQLSLGVDVDSHAIAHNMNLHDAVEVLEGLFGAYALIWHDSRDNSVNFARNNDRPLVMWQAEKGDTMFFGSEQKMMEWIMSRNYIRAGNGKFYTLPVGQLWKYLPGTIEPEITNFKVRVSTYNGYDPYGDTYGAHQWQDYQRNYRRNKADKATVTTINSGNVRRLPPPSDVPEPVVALLKEEGLDQTDRLPFLPTAIVSGIVVGVIEYLDLPCFLIGQNKFVANKSFDTRWTVRPTGIRRLPNTRSGVEETVVMARLVSWYYHDSMWRYSTLGRDMEGIKQDDIPFDVGIELFKTGPSTVGDMEDWYASTLPGCDICQELPKKAEADDLEWLEEDGKFLCKQCAKMHTGE